MNRRVRAVTDGRTHEAGIGEPLTIAGPLPDVVLWLSGRATTDVELDAPVAEADDLRRRLAV